MNLVKNALILSLLLGKVVFAATEPQELLNSFRKMAQKERLNRINQLEEEYKHIEGSQLEEKKQLLAHIKGWNACNRLDHIKVLYYDSQGKAHLKYIQLEDSRFNFIIGSGFIYSLFFKPRVYSYNEKEVEEILKTLLNELPLDKQPNVIIYKSNKFREKQGKIFTSVVRDLYSVCIDYSDGRIPLNTSTYALRLLDQGDPQIDWSKKDRS